MAGSRTLKLSILAETKDLVDGLKNAEKSTETFGEKATEFGKKAALAFAVAGTAALAFAADAVKAAAQDQAAQEKLAETIRATTGATATQVKGVEDYITKTSIAIGVTDDELRPAFGRLVRSTKDVDEAQRLLNLALDLSVATGKPLESISNALGRAYDGNTTALGRLGLGLDANLLKSKDNEAIITSLETTYGRFAEGAAETAAVKFERIRIATDEAKESIGAALLPAVEQLMDYVIVTVVPNLESFINALTGQGSLEEATTNGTVGAFKFGEQLKKVIKTVISLKDEIIIVGSVLGALFVTTKIAAAVAGTIALIRGVITVMNALRTASIVAGIAKAFALNPIAGVAAVAVGAAVLAGATKLVANSFKGEGSSSGSVGTPGFSGTMPDGQAFSTSSPIDQTPAEKAQLAASIAQSQAFAKEVAARSQGLSATQSAAAAAAVSSSNIVSGNFNPGSFRAGEAATSGTTINVTVNGAVDKEGTARTIVDTLNNSFYRGTGGATNLQLA